MNRRMFGNLWARRAQLGRRHPHIWRHQDPSKDDRPPSAMHDLAQLGPPDPRAPASEPVANVVRKGQQDALTTWEDEGGTTKPVTRR